MGRPGFEPGTYGLKIHSGVSPLCPCSPLSANDCQRIDVQSLRRQKAEICIGEISESDSKSDSGLIDCCHMAKRTPGVTILKANPARRIGYRIRYVDPDSGKTVAKTIPADVARTVDTRRKWAEEQSVKLKARSKALDEGAARMTQATVCQGVQHYYKHATISESTKDAYESGSDKFVTWCEENGARNCRT